jgi:hypothetical protein
MPTSRIAVRLLTLLFLLAGILLLQKPVFGETITAVTTHFAVVIQAPDGASTTSATPCTASPSPSTKPRN